MTALATLLSTFIIIRCYRRARHHTMSSSDYIQMNASGEAIVIGDWYVEKRERENEREMVI